MKTVFKIGLLLLGVTLTGCSFSYLSVEDSGQKVVCTQTDGQPTKCTIVNQENLSQ